MDLKVLNKAVNDFLKSDARASMVLGEAYYQNKTLIQTKIIISGKSTNIKLENPFIRLLVDQKRSYLLGKGVTATADNDTLDKYIHKDIFNDSFALQINSICKEAINKGLCWVQVYVQGDKFIIKKHKTENIIPFYDENEQLTTLIRLYQVLDKDLNTIEKLERYTLEGVEYYYKKSGEYIKDTTKDLQQYVLKKDNFGTESINWGKIPFVAIKYNEEEQPLIDLIKSLLDEYNLQSSETSDLIHDTAHYIYVLKGYNQSEAKDLSTNLKDNRSISLASDGGIDLLQVQTNTQVVEASLNRLEQLIFTFGRGVNLNNLRGGSLTNVAIKAHFMELDMDCNNIELAFQKAFTELLFFYKSFLGFKGIKVDIDSEVNIIFNKDTMISEGEVITDIKNSVGIVSDETLTENHPYVTDAKKELERISKENKVDSYE